jgi:hypothetical protein
MGSDSPLYGREVMQERGRHFNGDSDLIRPYYDRQNKRQLYFTSLPTVPGVVSDPQVFGRPVPFYHFVGPNGVESVHPKNITCSEWMYYSQEPLP